MKKTAEVAHIRQLCSSGLGGQVIMPPLLNALHALISSSQNHFFWLDAKGYVANVYTEALDLPTLARTYAGSATQPPLIEAFTGITELLFGNVDVYNSARHAARRVRVSDAYRRYRNPFDFHHVLAGSVRERGVCIGLIMFTRSHVEPKFTTRDEERLESLLPYFSRGLQSSRNTRGPFSASGDTGLVIVDREGKIRRACSNGRRLAFLATHPSIAKDGSSEIVLASDVSEELLHLCRPLFDPHASGVRFERMRHSSPWGSFVFQAYALDDGECTGENVVGITVERQEPLPLRLIHSMRWLQLSIKQCEVCLLLSYGYGYAAIAERLTVKVSTVVDHVRKIYHKLGVSQQEELLRKLVAGPDDGAVWEQPPTEIRLA